MTETLDCVSPPEDAVSPPDGAQEQDRDLEGSAQPSAEELEIARELVRTARERGVALTGPDGLLKALTKTVIQTALGEEMSEHLGYDKHEVRWTQERELAQRGQGENDKPIWPHCAGWIQPVDARICCTDR